MKNVNILFRTNFNGWPFEDPLCDEDCGVQLPDGVPCASVGIKALFNNGEWHGSWIMFCGENSPEKDTVVDAVKLLLNNMYDVEKAYENVFPVQEKRQ